VARLVAKRQLVGLAEQDLRFRPEEIRELLERSKVSITESQARAIADSAEGWITGVLLLVDLLRTEAESAFLSAERATSQTYGYLASEVLERQPPDVRRFLHASAVLREMSVRLCREVLGLKQADALLDEIERRNLFLTRFGDNARATYRYHKLFRDFLQTRLRQVDPSQHDELHRRAGAWFEERHDVEEAVYHYLAAEAYPRATTLMDRVALEWFTRGRVEALRRWAVALPEEIKPQAPRLALYHSKLLSDRYMYDEAKHALAHAETGLSEQKERTQLAKVRIQQATLGLYAQRPEDAIREATEALSMLGQHELADRAQAQRMVGRAYLIQGRPTAGIDELLTALELFREAESPYDVLNVLQDLAFAYASQGHFSEAGSYLSEALPLARRLGSSAQLAGVLNNLGMLHYERGEYRRALALHQEGLTVARRADDARHTAYLAEGMATIYRDAGTYRQADRLYEMAWRIARKSRPEQAAEIVAARADLYRWQGDPLHALELLEGAEHLVEGNGDEPSRRYTLTIGRGIALAESGDTAGGIALLNEAIELLSEQERNRDLARGYLLLAKAHLLAGEERGATERLEDALTLIEEVGTAQFAVGEGRHARDLIELGLGRGVPGCRELAAAIEELSLFGRELTGTPERRTSRAGKRLEVYGLGEGRVVRDGEPVPSSAWQAAMARELFFYVFVHGPVERDAVGLIFWPDLPQEKVTNNFHSTLYRVRRAVGSDAIVVKGGQYQIGEIDTWYDVEEFDSLVERARLLPPRDWQTEELWRRAVDLYQGDFLEGVDREWCQAERRALWAKHVEALVGLGRCHQARAAYDEAVAWFRRALEADGLREDVHRRIMRCYAEAGQRSKALDQYARCREILEEELGVAPSPETARLYRELAGGS
jgi:DNA-binding SARP family transcriptional activator